MASGKGLECARFARGRWGGRRTQRSKDAAILAPKARSCANWKSRLSFNKVKGRGNFKMEREVKGRGFTVGYLCVPCRLGKLEGPPLTCPYNFNNFILI